MSALFFKVILFHRTAYFSTAQFRCTWFGLIHQPLSQVKIMLLHWKGPISTNIYAPQIRSQGWNFEGVRTAWKLGAPKAPQTTGVLGQAPPENFEI